MGGGAMASRADRRSGGLAVGFSGGAALALAAVFLSARPPDRLTADIHAEYVKYASGRDTLTLDLDATVAYVKTLKAARGDRVGVIGFCWGGGQSFRYATSSPSLRAFVVCYGPGPDTAAIARIRARGLGVYAEQDARI